MTPCPPEDLPILWCIAEQKGSLVKKNRRQKQFIMTEQHQAGFGVSDAVQGDPNDIDPTIQLQDADGIIREFTQQPASTNQEVFNYGLYPQGSREPFVTHQSHYQNQHAKIPTQSQQHQQQQQQQAMLSTIDNNTVATSSKRSRNEEVAAGVPQANVTCKQYKNFSAAQKHVYELLELTLTKLEIAVRINSPNDLLKTAVAAAYHKAIKARDSFVCLCAEMQDEKKRNEEVKVRDQDRADEAMQYRDNKVYRRGCIKGTEVRVAPDVKKRSSTVHVNCTMG